MARMDHIERFYNRRRLDQAMGYRSPEEFDQQEVELKATVPALSNKTVSGC
jgi:transposase InsO family protein